METRNFAMPVLRNPLQPLHVLSKYYHVLGSTQVVVEQPAIPARDSRLQPWKPVL